MEFNTRPVYKKKVKREAFSHNILQTCGVMCSVGERDPFYLPVNLQCEKITWVWILGQKQNYLEAPQKVGCKIIVNIPGF